MAIHIHLRDQIKAAGILFIAGNEVLLLKRSGAENYWDLPGGKAEPGETVKQTAVREAMEELGLSADFASEAPSALLEVSHTVAGIDYTTFAIQCDKFVPRLSFEHSAFVWAKPRHLPNPIHPLLKRLLVP